ncbi:MAG TPA: hypothetical protein VFP16_11270, partial [Vicinamibacterales bacterium]|nr:hypothetical protein [Vicinamibacterales bacterium]
MTRHNENAGTELAAEDSLHPIASFAALAFAQAPPARQACMAANADHDGTGGDDGAPPRRRDQRSGQKRDAGDPYGEI